MKKLLPLALFLLLLAPGALLAQAPSSSVEEAERAAVRAAVLDYVEGIYHVQPERIERSVHPSLAKVGYWLGKDTTAYKEGRMTFEELVELAGAWNKTGWLNAEEALKKIAVFDLLDQTATAKLSAHWGVDYLHLAKVDGRWMIMNVLWQSHPPDAP